MLFALTPMPLGMIFSNALFQKAGIAYLHYLSFIICVGALVLERTLLRVSLDRREIIKILITDIVYGIAALTIVASGILRVIYFGQGSEFYTLNPVFWTKIGIFIFVGLLSLYPTFTYILWAIPLRKEEVPEIKSDLIGRLGKIINIEIFGFLMIPLFATIMARGIGLNV